MLTCNFALLGAYSILPQFAAVVEGWRELQIGKILIWLAFQRAVVTLLLRDVDARLLLACGLSAFSFGAYIATYVGRCRGAGTSAAEHNHRLRVRGQLRRRGLATLALHRSSSTQLAIDICNRDFRTSL